MKQLTLIVFFVLVFVPGYAMSGEGAAEDDSYVFGVGPAGERDLGTKATSFGVELTVEKTVIENWLEIEIGVTRLNTAGRREMGAGVIFKKPFQLSRTAELMVGCGPQIARKPDGTERGTSLGGECVLDFMFWPTGSRDVGWYIEPSYDFGLGNRRGERSLGGSAGLLIRWR